MYWLFERFCWNNLAKKPRLRLNLITLLVNLVLDLTYNKLCQEVYSFLTLLVLYVIVFWC